MAKDIRIPVTLRGNRLEAKAQLGQTVIVKEGPEEYTDPVTVTPSESEQSLQTKDKLLTADVTVEPIPSEYIIPAGTEVISITENGTVSKDVTAKASVTVNTNVPIPPGYIIPTGSINISENGTFDVTEKASVNVDVPAPSGVMYEKHIVDFVLDASTTFGTIMSRYIKECANYMIYPTDADNKNTNTIVIGDMYNTAGKIGTITTPTGVATNAAVGQYRVNDQSYNALRIRSNVGNKPAGNYRLVFYGVPK